MSAADTLLDVSECITGRIPEAPDWHAVLLMANQHFITAELHEALATAPNCPDDVRSFLAMVAERNHERNAGLYDTLLRVLAVLKGSNIEPVLLKGAALWIEGDRLEKAPRTARISYDLDIAVAKPAFGEAIDALVASGFEIFEDARARAYHPTVVLAHPECVGAVDLHQYAPGPRGVPEIDNLHDNSRTVECSGLCARVPETELQILILALHDQLLDGHFWRGGFKLRHLIDIAQLSRREQHPVNWARLHQIARDAALLPKLSAYLWAAKTIADAPVPLEMLSAWGRVHFWRQRLQFLHPMINRPFHTLGLNRTAWRRFSRSVQVRSL